MAAVHIKCEEAHIVRVQVRSGEKESISTTITFWCEFACAKKRKKTKKSCLMVFKAHARNKRSMSANHTAVDQPMGG